MANITPEQEQQLIDNILRGTTSVSVDGLTTTKDYGVALRLLQSRAGSDPRAGILKRLSYLTTPGGVAHGPSR